MGEFKLIFLSKLLNLTLKRFVSKGNKTKRNIILYKFLMNIFIKLKKETL